MDNNESLREVGHGEHDVPHLRVHHEPAVERLVRPDDLQELKLEDMDQVKRILESYNALRVPREHVQEFTLHLLHRQDSWFVEAGDLGLFYCTDIVPGLDAQFHMIFWDQRLTADRREAAKLVLSAAQKLFNLRRITCVVVESNVPLCKTMRKIGFTIEGIIRQSRIVSGEFQNTHIYGLLKEEMTWPLLKTSLA